VELSKLKDETRICEGRFTLVDFSEFIIVILASLDSENSTSLAFKHIGKSENRFIIFRHEIRVRFRIQNLRKRREQTKTFLFLFSIRVQYKNVADSSQIRKKVLNKDVLDKRSFEIDCKNPAPGPQVKEDHQWRWTTFSGKFLHKPEEFYLCYVMLCYLFYLPHNN